jgi:peptidoglycan L-alanyl-D-glutamate endopeptidase CwlK
MTEALKDSPFDFGITEGVRTLEVQKLYVDRGKSRTMRSKHLTGDAVDIVVYDEKGKVTWDLTYYRQVAAHIKEVSERLKIPVTWGGDWKSLVDGPHFELKA